MRVSLKFLFSLILIFNFSIISFSQTEKFDESSAVFVTEQAMKQIVQRILIWSFKPGKQKKVVYLAGQGLQKAWLPEIKNIEFRLLSDEEIRQSGKEIYFFTKPEQSGNRFSIGFAFGTLNCDYFGKTWQFRISKQRVRLWQGGGFGGGCASDAQMLPQSNQPSKEI